MKERYFHNYRSCQLSTKLPLQGTSLGPVVKNLPYNAGDTGSIPVQGTKIPHAAGQLNPRATAAELAHLN